MSYSSKQMRVALRGMAPAILMLAGCRAAPEPVAQKQMAPLKVAPSPVPGDLERPLDARESAIAENLTRLLTELASGIGARNSTRPWELAATTDYLAELLTEDGFDVQRQGYPLAGGDVVAQNLVLTLRGSVESSQWTVIGAAYDTLPDSDDELGNATGVAALLELARALRASQRERPFRLVLFGSSRIESDDAATLGGMRLAAQMAADGEQIAAMIELGSLGLGASGRVSEWLFMVEQDERSAAFASELATGLRTQGRGLLEVRTEAAGALSSQTSAAWAFRQLGHAAVAARVTSIATPETLSLSTIDLGRTARLIRVLERTVTELATRKDEVSTPFGERASLRPDAGVWMR